MAIVRTLTIAGGKVTAVTVGAVRSSDMEATGVTAGSYTHASITVDAAGRVTAAASGSVTSGTVTSVAAAAPAAGLTVTGGPITGAGTLTFALADDLAALEGLTGTNTIYYRSGASTWSPVTIGGGLTFSGGTLAASGGTLTAVAVASANGFTGTSDGASPTATLTLTTSVTGLLKGNGTAVSAAVAGTDYLTPAGAAALYQPLDDELSSLAAASSTGIYYRAAAGSWLPITVGSGLTFGSGTLSAAAAGTVTGVSVGNLSPLFTSSVATSTTTPAVSFTLSTQTANTVLAGPTTGGAAAPTFRALVAADVPDLSATYSTAGHTHSFASLTSKPTTLAGYGITDGQPLNANLTALAALTFAANTFPARASSGALAAKTITDFGLSLVDDADAAAGRSTLGLGTAATASTGTCGTAVPLLDGANTWSASQAFAAVTATGLNVKTTGTAHYQGLAFNSALTGARTLTIQTDDAAVSFRIVGTTPYLSGTNTGDQTITLTGDVTGSGTGSFAATIGAGKVTNAMLAGSIDLTTKVTGTLPAANLPTAAQADQETATSTTTLVTPGRQHYHPSAAKAWVTFTVSAGTVTVKASYNVSSVSRSAAGVFTVNFTTAFSGADVYAMTGAASIDTGGATLLGVIYGGTSPAPAAGSCAVSVVNFSTGAAADPKRCTVVFFGDQ